MGAKIDWNKKVKWHGETKCDFCGNECNKELYDAKTMFGPWAVMCPTCFLMHGVGLGLGVGQRYRKNKDGEFIQV